MIRAPFPDSTTAVAEAVTRMRVRRPSKPLERGRGRRNLKAGSSSEQDWRCERDAHGDADAVCEKAIEKIEEDLCVVSPYHLHNLLPILDKDIWIFGLWLAIYR